MARHTQPGGSPAADFVRVLMTAPYVTRVLCWTCLLTLALLPLARAGVYVETAQVFTRYHGKPVADTVRFDAQPGASYVLEAVNGPEGATRVSSAEVWLNGVLVFGENAFNQNVFRLSDTVTPGTANTLTILIKSGAAGSALQIRVLGIDSDAPQIAVFSPPNGSTIATRTPLVAVAYSDTRSGVDLSSLRIHVDGVDWTARFASGQQGAAWQVPQELALAEGARTVVASIADRAGNVAQVSAVFTVDVTAPVVEIVSPANGSLANQPTIPVSWTVDGVEQTADLTASFVEGANVISRSAADAAGNTGTASVTVTLDTQAPVVEILSPANGSLTNQGTVVVQWTVDGVAQTAQTTQVLTEGANVITRSVADAAGNTGTASVTVTLDTQAPVVEIVSPNEGDVLGSSPVVVIWRVDGVEQAEQATQDLVEGPNEITRSATDAAGNVGITVVRVTRQSNAALAVSIVSPAEGALVIDTQVGVDVRYSGSRLNASSLQVALNGQDVTSRLARQSDRATGLLSINSEKLVTLSLSGGMTDTLEPGVYIGLTFSVSWPGYPGQGSPNLAPALTGVNVSYCATCQSTSVCTPSTGAVPYTSLCVRSLLSGKTYPLDFVFWSSPTPSYYSSSIRVSYRRPGGSIVADGVNAIVARICDSSGTCAHDTNSFLVDLPPTLSIVSPARDTSVNLTPLAVRYAVDGQVRERMVSLAQGLNEVVIDTVDGYGRRVADTVRITLDTQAPVVRITSPSQRSWTNRTSIAVAWSVDGVAQTTQLSQTLAVEGTNLVVRTATDAAGNVGRDTVVVLRDTQTPVVRISSPANLSYTNVTPVAVVWTVDGVVQTTQNSEPLAEGLNAISRTATDLAGNVGRDSVRVTLDRIAPVVEIVSPVDGQEVVDSLIQVVWRVDGVAQTVQSTQVLTPGENVIVRSTTDFAGNTGTDTARVLLIECAVLSGVNEQWDSRRAFSCLVLRNSTIVARGGVTAGRVRLEGLSTLVADDTVHAGVLEVCSQSTLTHSAPPVGQINRLVIQAQRLVVSSGGAIDVSGKGCPAGYLPDGAENSGTSYYYGGVHAGYGGWNASEPYGNYEKPTLPGGGGGPAAAGLVVGRGGGCLTLRAGVCIVDGTITAGGIEGTYYGSGAGGSVLIEADSLIGHGSITARGGPIGYRSPQGGGGRVALKALEYLDFPIDGVEVDGYGMGTLYVAAPGTRLLRIHSPTAAGTAMAAPCAVADPDLSVEVGNQGKVRFDNPAIMKSLLIRSGGTVASGNGPHALIRADSIRIDDGGLLTQMASDSVAVRRLVVDALLVHTAAGGRIDVSGKGYPSGYTAGGRVFVNDYAGGSHGGRGGGLSAASYGNAPRPYLPGGGGGYQCSGGGVLRILSRTVRLGGETRADGAMNDYLGSGAGGSIWITADTLEGTGVVSARAPMPTNGSGYQGGGGRIAVCAAVVGGYTGTLDVSGWEAGSTYWCDGTSEQDPQVAIAVPLDSSRNNHNPERIHWQVNGIWQTSDTLEWLTEGWNTVVRGYVAPGGAESFDTVSLQLDTEAPPVVIHAPSDGDTVRLSPLPVRWSVGGTQVTNRRLVEWLTEGDNTVKREFTDDLGNVSVDSVRVTYQPYHRDLVALDLDISQVATDTAAATIAGQVNVRFTNAGDSAVTTPFRVVVFEDRNWNQRFDAGTDQVYGGATVGGANPGDTASVAIAAAGSVEFVGNVVWAFIDSAAVVDEASERNNLVSSRSGCVQETAGAGIGSPRVAWEKKGFDISRQPLVLQMTDDNADGRVDTLDVPDIVFGDYSIGEGFGIGWIYRLWRVSGDGSSAPVALDTNALDGYYAELGAADIDNDGKMEIVGIGPSRVEGCWYTQQRVKTFDDDGTFLWQSSPPLDFQAGWYWSTQVADLDSDGSPEVIAGGAVFGADGSARARFDHGFTMQVCGGSRPTTAGSSTVVDLNLDGQPEIITSRDARTAGGSVVWARETGNYRAVANLDDDIEAEIISTAGGISVLEHDGTTKWGPIQLTDICNVTGRYLSMLCMMDAPCGPVTRPS